MVVGGTGGTGGVVTTAGPRVYGRCSGTDLFDESHLALPYHSVNTDINKRIKYLPGSV
jgi:hypothetical protein